MPGDYFPGQALEAVEWRVPRKIVAVWTLHLGRAVVYWIRNYSPFLCYLLLLTRYYIITYYYFLHFEHASDSFSLLINSSWLLVFAIILFVTTIEYTNNYCCLIFLSYSCFFWTSFHSLSSTTLGIISHEAFYLPDPCELTFANTLLLSNAAIVFIN